MARPRKDLTEEHLAQIEKLAGYGLTEAAIAHVVGISSRTWARRKASPDVLAALEKGKAKAEAIIGQALFLKAKAGDLGAIVWWEKTRTGRMDQQRHEITGKDGAPLLEAKVVRERIAGRLARLAPVAGTVGAPGEPERN